MVFVRSNIGSLGKSVLFLGLKDMSLRYLSCNILYPPRWPCFETLGALLLIGIFFVHPIV